MYFYISYVLRKYLLVFFKKKFENYKKMWRHKARKRFNAVSMIYVYVHILVLSSQICLLLKFSQVNNPNSNYPKWHNATFHRNTLTRLTTKRQETHKLFILLYKQTLRKREEKRNTNIYNNIQGQHYIYIYISIL